MEINVEENYDNLFYDAQDWNTDELHILYENEQRNTASRHSSCSCLEISEAAKSAPTGEVGSGEKPAPAPISDSSETTPNAVPTAAAAGGDSIAHVAEPVPADKVKAVPVTPPVTPVISGEQPQFPPIPAPIAQPATNSEDVSTPSNPSAALIASETTTSNSSASASEVIPTPEAPKPADKSNLPAPGNEKVVEPSIPTVPTNDIPPSTNVSEVKQETAGSVTILPTAPIDASPAPATPTEASTGSAIAATAGLAAGLINTAAGITLAATEPVSETPATPVSPIPSETATPAFAAAIPAALAAVPAAAAATVPSVPVVAPPQSAAAKSDSNDEWTLRQSELLNAVLELESAKRQAASDALSLQLKVRDEEIDVLKARVQTLETELISALSKPGTKSHALVETIKQQHEELLNKARGMIFDKTKIVKNQELQIEALNIQVASLKDVNAITKDLLEIRNSEVKHLEERLESVESRYKAGKEHYMHAVKRAETGQSINDDLKKEYETQLKIFKELREKYEQRVQALMAENKRLADTIAANAGTQDGSTSGSTST